MRRRHRDAFVLQMKRVASGLEPATQLDEEMLDAYKLGAIVECTIVQEKSNEQLRLLWGFCGFVIDATQRWPTKETMMAALLTALGYFQRYDALMGGGIRTFPMSLRDMDHATLNRFCESAFELIASETEITVDDYKNFQRDKARQRRR